MKPLAATLSVVVALLLAGGPAHAASGGPVGHPHLPSNGCRADRSPGVVTRWEFDHALLRDRRHRVECSYGVHGARVSEFVGDMGAYETIDYPTADGTTTDVVYLMRGDGARLLASRHWYAADGTVLAVYPTS